MSTYIDLVTRYAPAVKFHEDEKFFPCSIEFLLQGSTLNYRTWRGATPIDSQHAVTPAVASFGGYLYIIYPGTDDGGFWVSRSTDGSGWTDTTRIGQQGSTPAVAAFQGMLWIVYSGKGDSQLHVSRSADGLTWEPSRVIPGQSSTGTPALAAMGDKLHMCYTASQNNQLCHSQSDNGWDWPAPSQVDTPASGVPSLAVVNDTLIMICTDRNGAGTLWQSGWTENNLWSHAQPLVGPSAVQAALAFINGWLVMTFSDKNSTQLYCTRSRDGQNWQDLRMVAGQTGSVPALTTMGDRVYMIYALGSDKQLYVTSNRNGNLQPFVPIPIPSQALLQQATNADSDYWINIAESQWPGQPIPSAPMYYAVQEDDTKIYLHYLFLYARQGGQTVQGSPGTSVQFNAIIWNVGTHPGDLEHFAVTLDKGAGHDGTYTFESATFEAHGNQRTYPVGQINFHEETHPIISIGLNGHGIWNEAIVSNPVWDEGGYVPPFVGIGDFFATAPSSAIWWYPYSQSSPFRLLGLDAQGIPISDQAWSAYYGRIGDSYWANLTGASYFDGQGLSGEDWAIVNVVWVGGKVLGKIRRELQESDGPIGPGSRAWNNPLPRGVSEATRTKNELST